MPLVMKHDPKKGYYVQNTATGKSHGYCSSRKKCEAQLRLLNAIEHGFKPK